VNAYNGPLAGYDVATGQPKVTARVGGTVFASPVIASGVMYVPTSGGVLYALGKS
jgi:hypothetical protein